jgi:hypothetical protein
MASRDSKIEKHFLFRFDDGCCIKIVAISVISSVIRMNGVPLQAVRQDPRLTYNFFEWVVAPPRDIYKDRCRYKN